MLFKLFVLIGLISICNSIFFTPAQENSLTVDLTDKQLAKKHNVDDASKLKWSQRQMGSPIDDVFQLGCREIDLEQPRANAGLVMLARNQELKDVVKSMKSLERHFNQWFQYPWIFLNDEEFDDAFKAAVRKHTRAEVKFGTIPQEHWDFDPAVDVEEKEAYINSQGDRSVLYGGLESYHKMCRYFSGFFFKHELVKKLDWYWRVEPNVQFFCDITYDPFVEMEKHGKKYGFTVMIRELYPTVPNLFRYVQAFITENSHKVGSAWWFFSKHWESVTGEKAKFYDGIRDRLKIFQKIETNMGIKKMLAVQDKKSSDLKGIYGDYVDELVHQAKEPPQLHWDLMNGEEWNSCHFWSNFEIARVDLFESPVYEKFFQFLDQSGGFYKERWGDAAVHSLAMGLMLEREELHYFRDIGYQHGAIGHCPKNFKKNQLEYTPAAENVRDAAFKRYKADEPAINGVGCRCRCPSSLSEYEDEEESCMKPWHRATRKGYVRKEPIDVDKYEELIGEKLDQFLDNEGLLGESRIAESLQ